jgi:hypothetical protein
MQYWQEYIRSSYELVLLAEGKSATYLDDDIESYLARLVARWFDKNDIPPDTPVAIMLMTAMSESGSIKEIKLAEVAEVCLFYDSFKIKQRRWPSLKYYKDIGTTAYGLASVVSNDSLYSQLENNFDICSKVLGNIRPGNLA